MQVYTTEEARKNALEFFNGDELAAHVWVNKYALRNLQKEIVEASPKERFLSIAGDIDNINLKYGNRSEKDEYERALLNGYIIPAGSGLFGIANPYSYVSLGNCFVISGKDEDSIGSIYLTDQQSAQIYKRRGGVGTDLSHLRYADAVVSNAAGSTTGTISFGEQFSSTVRRIGQNGRRGALMLSLHVNHLDILQFIRAKNDKSSLTGANVSVKVTDEFMQAVHNDGYYLQRFPVTAPSISMLEMEEDQMYNTPDGTVYKKVKARKIFDELVRVNWESAEPGMLFWDKIISESPADCYASDGFRTESTNPCGELPLSPYDSCRLLSINATKYVVNPYTRRAFIDWESFRRDSAMAMRMMDNIIDLEIEKIKSIIKKIESDPESDFTKMVELNLWESILRMTEKGRRSGISVIGHGDFLAMLGIQYGSAEGNTILEELHKVNALAVYNESVELARVRGAFEVFDFEKELDNPFLNRLYSEDPDLRLNMERFGRRNIAILTIPPSGSLSILLRQTSGIEPVFLLWYFRNRKVNPGEVDKVDFVDETGDSWQTYKVFHPKLLDWFNQVKEDYWDLLPTDKLEDMDAESDGFREIIEASPWYGSTTEDIDPISKVLLQGAIQQWVDHSISVTHNLPKNVSKETVAKLYMTSWEAGCKGCTIYRDGSRSGVLVKESESKTESTFEYRDAPKRPRELPCDIYYPTIHGKRYVVLVGLFEGKPYEVFAFQYKDILSQSITTGILKKQKSGTYHLLGSDGDMLVENIRSRFDFPDWDFATRMISTALRHGASIDFVVDQLNKAHGLVVTDYIKVIARQLKKYLKPSEEDGTPCPECGTPMRVEGGCMQCVNPECGYGKCG